MIYENKPFQNFIEWVENNNMCASYWCNYFGRDRNALASDAVYVCDVGDVVDDLRVPSAAHAVVEPAEGTRGRRLGHRGHQGHPAAFQLGRLACCKANHKHAN
jgi:hypothetical protein